MKKLFLLIITFVCCLFYIPGVSAATLATQNICDPENSTDNVILGDGTCITELQTNNGIVSSVEPSQELVPKTKTGYKSYDVIFLVDVSHSMLNGNKVAKVNEALIKGINTLVRLNNEMISNGSDKRNRYKICSFGSEYKCLRNYSSFKIPSTIAGNTTFYHKEEADGDKTMNKGYIDGNTNTALGLIKASSDLAPNKRGKYKSNGHKYKNRPMIILITDGYPTESNGTQKLGNVSSPRNFVSAIDAMKSFKGMENSKLITVGIMNQNDTVANFLINPNEDNWNNLANNNNQNIASVLKKIYNPNIRSKRNSSKKIYDAVVGTYKAPEKGIWYANVNENNKKIKFTVNCNWLNFGEKWFIMPGKNSGNKIFKYEGHKVSDINYPGTYTTYKSEFNYHCSSSSATKTFTFKYTDGTHLRYTKLKDYANRTYDNSIVDASTVTLNNFSDWLANAIKEVVTETEWDLVPGPDINSNKHTGVCYESQNEVTGNYWYKPSSVVNAGQSDEIQPTDADGNATCIRIRNLVVPYIVIADAVFKFGNYSPVTYAGGGYKFENNSVESSFTMKYGLRSSTDNIMFSSVELNKQSLDDSNEFISLENLVDVTEVYTDSTCTTNVASSNLGIESSVNSNAFSDADFKQSLSTRLFKTVNSNTVSNELESFNHIISQSDNIFNFELPNACIDSQTAFVSYGNCSNAGKLRYVPLKYASNSVPITLDNQNNISRYRDITIRVNSTCEVDVKQQLYNCPSGECTVAYKYRSVDNNNPFPKAGTGPLNYEKDKIALNWREWITNQSNFNRMKNAYLNDNLHYVYNYNSVQNSQVEDNSSYLDWSNMNSDGTSEYINQSNGFTEIKNREESEFCNLGLATYNGSSCGLGW